MSTGNIRPPHLQAFNIDFLLESVIGVERSPHMDEVLRDLPKITESQLDSLGHKDSVCPICLNTFLAIIAEEEMAEVMDSPGHPAEELGVTRLSQDWQCGHVFCRRDITKWINEGKVTCPTCRKPLAKSNPPNDQDSRPAQRLDREEAMRQFQRQVEDIVGVIPSHARASAPRRADDEGFSGMYS